MKVKFHKMLITIFLVITAIFLFLYFFQEKLIFFPEKLPSDFKFSFFDKFEENYISTDDGQKIHYLHFLNKNPNGLVFYLHGNAGSSSSWGRVYKPFYECNYDVVIPDYRGYGKSSGKISSEKRADNDLLEVYDQIVKKYDYQNIIIAGYSLGSGFALKLAAQRNPNKLILKAPFYNFNEMRKEHFGWFPQFLMRYKFQSDIYIKEVACPILIFHGTDDSLIPIEQGEKLSLLAKGKCDFIKIPNQEHNGIESNSEYLTKIYEFLK